MEFPSTGGILNSWVIRTAKLLRYVNNFDYFVAAAEGLFVLFLFYFTIEEFLDVNIFKSIDKIIKMLENKVTSLFVS